MRTIILGGSFLQTHRSMHENVFIELCHFYRNIKKRFVNPNTSSDINWTHKSFLNFFFVICLLYTKPAETMAADEISTIGLKHPLYLTSLAIKTQ